MKNWKTQKSDGKTFSTFRVNIGGYHRLVDCVTMKQVKEYVREQFPTFIHFHGNNSFTIKRLK